MVYVKLVGLFDLRRIIISFCYVRRGFWFWILFLIFYLGFMLEGVKVLVGTRIDFMKYLVVWLVNMYGFVREK